MALRADDNTLWAIGLGEIDRNVIPRPVPVQPPRKEDFHGYEIVTPVGEDLAAGSSKNDETLNSSSTPSQDSVQSSDVQPIKLPDTVRLCKGHQRISLLFDRSTIPFPLFGDMSKLDDEEQHDHLRIDTRGFELILNEEEAFLQPFENLTINSQQETNNSSDDQLSGADSNNNNLHHEILDLSTGWQHSVLILNSRSV